MSQTYIPPELRRLVAERTRYCCEYCRIHEDDVLMGCHVDHIISEKHGGETVEQNLAYACAFCNLNKGSDVGSLFPVNADGVFYRFFNPRSDIWSHHFSLAVTDGVTITSHTSIGLVTARIFGFNRLERILERTALLAVGRYPVF